MYITELSAAFLLDPRGKQKFVMYITEFSAAFLLDQRGKQKFVLYITELSAAFLLDQRGKHKFVVYITAYRHVYTVFLMVVQHEVPGGMIINDLTNSTVLYWIYLTVRCKPRFS